MRTTDDFLADYEQLLREAARARLAGRRRPRLRRGRGAWIAVPALVAAALLAIPSGDAPERTVPPRPQVAAPPASFAILEQRPVPKVALGELVHDPAVRRSGLRWSQARLATQRDAVTAYVVPAAGKTTCLVAVEERAGTSLTCGELAKAPRFLIGVRIGLDDRTSVIVSLVPDGAETATVREDGADPVTVAVTNNVVVARLGHAPAKLHWQDRSGDYLVPLAPSARWSDHTGPAGGGSIAVRAAIPGTDGDVGVLAYRTKAGRVCLVAGPIQDGRVGRIGPNGFRALDPADAPGSCGEFRENFADFGGIALAHSHVDDAGDRPQGIVYGLLAAASTAVRVTWSDGSTANATISPVDDPDQVGEAQAAFAAVAAPGVGPNGARVELLRPDGTRLHAFDF